MVKDTKQGISKNRRLFKKKSFYNTSFQSKEATANMIGNTTLSLSSST